MLDVYDDVAVVAVAVADDEVPSQYCTKYLGNSKNIKYLNFSVEN
jgi:hypothetical protein